MYPVEFYQNQNEQKPVRDFLLSLRPKPRGKVLQRIQILSEFGIDLPFPYSSQIEGRLRELRVRDGKNQYRVLYYGDANRVFVLLHAFEKRSQKLPQREIRIAMERMNADRKRKEG
ncbi:MAG: type II toxin-antitoxin system RelE/ParE family toxin [Gemmatimonadetes bacterium]|nr:type II toxin-antitoxin system RelE/ParE family toxin [Gemmatimonadota bacterium]MXY83357.1 type II toxin-antitoxin system RelE/ParE family toxin [Gemmatimonadota bacterium]MYB69451.1 type II toxin-antitoxin system RelE/ParE family toxin [Gemmatimonadota bacterium]